mgnify:CR=1 FL=1
MMIRKGNRFGVIRPRWQTYCRASRRNNSAPSTMKKDIGKPDQQFRVRLRVAAQRVADDHEEKIRRGNNQTHGEPNRSLAAVRRDTQRHSDYCEGHTRKRERKPFVYFGAAGAALPFVFAFQLFEQLLDRQRGTARPFFLFLVKLLETDRQCAFDHINSVPNLSQVGWVLSSRSW